MLYVALNGDDVGSKIGTAVANDDHEGLDQTRQSVAKAHQMIDKWVQSHGGKEISSSGDEGIYALEESALKDLEKIKAQYEKISGHSLTVGTGSTMSEASKALIYGKLNGKNQVVEYSEEVEDAISQSIFEEDGALEDEAPEDLGVADEVEPEQEGETEALSPEDIEAKEKIKEEGEVPSAEVEQKFREEKEENAEEEEIEQAPSDDVDDIDGEKVADDIVSEQQPPIDGKVPESDLGEGEEDTGEFEAAPEQKEVESEDSVYEDINQEAGIESEDEEGIEGEEGEEVPEEKGDSNDDQLSDLIHAHMNEEEAPEEGGEELDEGDLKAQISEALMAFRANKDQLEAAQQENPELYEATITMLRAMIEMAKKQGIDAQDDMEGNIAQEEMEGGFPYSGDGEEQDEEAAEAPAIPPQASGEKSEKKLQGRPQ